MRSVRRARGAPVRCSCGPPGSVVAEEGHVLATPRGSGAHARRRSRRGPARGVRDSLLLERERGVGASELALHEGHLLLPGERHELHVAKIPIVVRDADAGWPALRLRLTRPMPQGCRWQSTRTISVGAKGRRRAGRREPASESSESDALCSWMAARAEGPPIAAVADEVHSRLREQRRDAAARPAPKRRSVLLRRAAKV